MYSRTRRVDTGGSKIFNYHSHQEETFNNANIFDSPVNLDSQPDRFEVNFSHRERESTPKFNAEFMNGKDFNASYQHSTKKNRQDFNEKGGAHKLDTMKFNHHVPQHIVTRSAKPSSPNVRPQQIYQMARILSSSVSNNSYVNAKRIQYPLATHNDSQNDQKQSRKSDQHSLLLKYPGRLNPLLDFSVEEELIRISAFFLNHSC
jgi:hypothetical protein